LSQALWQANDAAALKKTERWIKDEGLDFAILSEDNLQDEHNRPVKKLVLNAVITAGRKKRKSVLMATIHGFGKNALLFANDGRAGRRWVFLESSEPTIEHVLSAIEQIVIAEGKDTVIIPTGSLVKPCRALVQQASAHQFKAENIDYRLALEVYSHGKDDIQAYIDESKRHLPNEQMTHLDRLEAEAIHIIREVIGGADNPVMLYSVGKDSAVMLHLARKAFYPSPPPFPLLHVDTTWKFQAMYDYRAKMAEESGMELLVHSNPEGVEKGINPFDHGSSLHTDIMKTQALKQALDHYKFDVAFGGARRDEEKSRAKERVFSFRTSTHRWDPKNQRPELWHQYNDKKNPGESIRVFPLSNWTELDIWQYIYREQIPLVPLYFAQERPVVERDGMLMMVDDDRMQLYPHDTIEMKKVRFRSLGCYPLTSAVESEADDLASIILELLSAVTSERDGRAIDNDTDASMEKKKQEGYF
ncbi:MAG: sulfate adenylyltransferase subunit CysD, partial [Gammaproteobacteria bacterium]|nr:sulfate adenylyltransferase subunit CysD [Gammaproteobacteria bacterium]